MSFIIRGMKSIIRKPFKSLLLILLVILISIFIFSGISSKNANIRVQTNSREVIDSGFQITENIENMRKRLNAEGTPVYLPNGAVLSQAPNHQFDSVLMSDILKISNVDGIKSYNIVTANTVVKQVNFDRIYDEERDQSSDFGGVNLIGILDMEQYYLVKGKYLELLEGRYINEKDEDVIVISEDLAKNNNLKLGDELSFSNIKCENNAENYSATIIGIFKINEQFPSIYNGDTYRSENTIFANLRFPEKPEGYLDDPLYAYATFQIEDLTNYDEIIRNVKKLDIDWERYNIIDSNGVSETLATNFSNIDSVTNMMLNTIFICSFAILFLMFTFWVKNRNYEIGIFLSLGKIKFEIISQIVLEVLVISIIALIISSSFAPKISNRLAEYVILNQNQIVENNNSDYISSNASIEREELADVRVGISTNQILEVDILIMIFVAIASCLSCIRIMIKKPKTILNDMK